MTRKWYVLALCAALSVACATGKSTPNPDGPEAAEAPKTAKEDPVDTTQREVRFEAEGLELAGTLSLPDGFSADAKAPALVLVHGSGPNARDQVLKGQLGMGFVTPIPVFARIAERMRAEGFVVLRYDKRTCGPFNGCSENGYPEPSPDLTADVFIDDAHAARSFLASVEGVDPDRIVYVGHSQGGGFGPEALARPGFAGGVLLAANMSPIDALIARQRGRVRSLLEGMGAPPQAIDAQTAPMTQTVRQLEALRAGGEEAPDAVGGASATFWRSHFEIDARRAERLATLERPIHLLFGDYDWNVDEKEAQAWREALESVPEGVTTSLVVMPEITHALNAITQPDATKITPGDIGADVDPRVLDWIAEVSVAIVK